MYFPCVLVKSESGENQGVYCVQFNLDKKNYNRRYLLWDEFIAEVGAGEIVGFTVVDGELIALDFDLDNMTHYTGKVVTQQGVVVIGAQWVRGRALTKMCYIDKDCKVHTAWEEVLINDVQMNGLVIANAKVRRLSAGDSIRMTDVAQFRRYNIYEQFDTKSMKDPEFLAYYNELCEFKSRLESVANTNMETDVDLQNLSTLLPSLIDELKGLVSTLISYANKSEYKLVLSVLDVQPKLEQDLEYINKKLLLEVYPLDVVVPEDDSALGVVEPDNASITEYGLKNGKIPCVLCKKGVLKRVTGGKYVARCGFCNEFYLKWEGKLASVKDHLMVDESETIVVAVTKSQRLKRQKDLYASRMFGVRHTFERENHVKCSILALLRTVDYYISRADILRYGLYASHR